MERLSTLAFLVLALLACGAAFAESELLATRCKVSPTPCEQASDTGQSPPVAPTLAQSAKETGVWLRERLFRHVRVDPAWYPQRAHSKPS